MDLREQLKSAGVYPSGPVSAWPKERNDKLIADAVSSRGKGHVKPTPVQMTKNMFRTAGQAIKHGKVGKEVREERYDMCKQCPAFLADSKRCSECGCFMEAKTWIGGDPKKLCPLKKWSR